MMPGLDGIQIHVVIKERVRDILFAHNNAACDPAASVALVGITRRTSMKQCHHQEKVCHLQPRTMLNEGLFQPLR
jgi:hypothetical protein